MCVGLHKCSLATLWSCQAMTTADVQFGQSLPLPPGEQDNIGSGTASASPAGANFWVQQAGRSVAASFMHTRLLEHGKACSSQGVQHLTLCCKGQPQLQRLCQLQEPHQSFPVTNLREWRSLSTGDTSIWWEGEGTNLHPICSPLDWQI